MQNFEIAALREQAEKINGNTILVIVEDNLIKRFGNLLYPSMLWVDATPNDDLNFAQGLPNVVIFPSSPETAKIWGNRGVGKVINYYLSNPQSLIDKWLTDTAEEEKKYNKILKEEIAFLTQNL